MTCRVWVGSSSTAFSKDVEIFEIDHPATQTLKLERIKECGVPLPRSVHLVAADLASESLEATLDRSPFRRGEPAFFLGLVQCHS